MKRTTKMKSTNIKIMRLLIIMTLYAEIMQKLIIIRLYAELTKSYNDMI